jgi:hypothetical protein
MVRRERNDALTEGKKMVRSAIWMGLLVAVVTGCSSGDVQTQAPAEIKAGVAAKPPAPKPVGSITTTPKTNAKHWGCNHNTSCKLNCEWCGINGTCTCRLKGID